MHIVYTDFMVHVSLPLWLKVLAVVIMVACLGAVGYTLVTGNNVITVVFQGVLNTRNPEVRTFRQLKEAYSNKKWHGTLQWTSTASIIKGSLYRESGTVTVKEMLINFNAPYTDSFTMYYAGGPRVSVDGKAAIASYSNIIDGVRVVPQVAYPIPFTLDGTINFKEKNIYFVVADPDSKKEYQTIYYPPNDEPLEGDNTTLGSYFHVPDATYSIQNGKMVINGLLQKGSTKLTVSGVLDPL